MKKALLLFLIFPFLVNAQDKFPVNSKGLVEYKQTESVEAYQADLYKRAKLFIASKFVSPKNVVTMDDKENGIIKVAFYSPFIEGRELHMTMQLLLADNKYQYCFTDILVPVEPNFQQNMTAEGVIRRIKEKTDKNKKPIAFLVNYEHVADTYIKSLIADLNNTMQSSTTF